MPSHASAGRRRVAIIGGGISGLTAAYELQRIAQTAPVERGWECTLFEASARLGGIVETVREQGFAVECGPDSWVTEKPWARELAEELGLGTEIIPSNDARKRTYLVQEGSLVPLPSGMRMMVPTQWKPLLASPLFSAAAKLAYQQEPERAEELKQTSLLSRGESADESVADFVLRHFGSEVTDKVAGPLLAGVFGGNVARLSVRAVMAPFVRMEAEYGSLITALEQRKHAAPAATFTTLASGLGTLTDALAAHLPPAAVHCGVAVDALERVGRQWRVVTAGNAQVFDAVILATSLDPTRRLLRSIAHHAAETAAALLPEEASSAIVAALGFTLPQSHAVKLPEGFGFLVPPQPVAGLATAQDPAALSLLACTFVEQKFAHRAPPGGILLRGFFGGDAAKRLAGCSDAEIARLAHTQLARLLGPLPPPVLTLVRRWPHSLPQYAVGHLSRLKKLHTHMEQLPALILLGNAYRGVGLPDLVRDARAAARNLSSLKF